MTKQEEMNKALRSLDFPFFYDGMSYEQFEKERIYFIEHFDDFMKLRYVPLYAQDSDDGMRIWKEESIYGELRNEQQRRKGSK